MNQPQSSVPPPDGAEVGYRKPPKHGQFKKGQSGNPAGRRKKNGNLFHFAKNLLREEPLATMSGNVEISKLEGIVRAYVSKASKGHSRSFRKFWRYAQKAKLFEVPKESSAVVVHHRVDASMFRKDIERMCVEREELLARIQRGELKELERIGYGK